MITCGWSCVSGPLCAPTRQPAPLQSDGHGLRSRRGHVTAPGTTPYQVLLLSTELCSPRKIVADRPSVTSAARMRELRYIGPSMVASWPPLAATGSGMLKSYE